MFCFNYMIPQKRYIWSLFVKIFCKLYLRRCLSIVVLFLIEVPGSQCIEAVWPFLGFFKSLSLRERLFLGRLLFHQLLWCWVGLLILFFRFAQSRWSLGFKLLTPRLVGLFLDNAQVVEHRHLLLLVEVLILPHKLYVLGNSLLDTKYVRWGIWNRWVCRCHHSLGLFNVQISNICQIWLGSLWFGHHFHHILQCAFGLMPEVLFLLIKCDCFHLGPC